MVEEYNCVDIEHVNLTMRFDKSERSELKERYKQALVDRVSKFIE